MKVVLIKKFGFYFAELIITTGLYLALVWYFASEGYIFSSYNREISWFIVTIFGAGIVMVSYHLVRLYQEDAQILKVYDRISNFKTAMLNLLQKNPAPTQEMLANGTRKVVDEYFAILDPSAVKQRIYHLVNITLAMGTPDLEALSSQLQRRESVKGARIRYIAGILILLGLLGTFLGLVQAVKYLQHFFTATEQVDFATLFSDMKRTLGGLDKAFGTSIGGIIAYLVLGYLSVVLRTKRSVVLEQIEEISREHLMPLLFRFQAKTGQTAPARSIEGALQGLPEAFSRELEATFEKILHRTIGESSAQLNTTAASLQRASEGLQDGQQLFLDMVNSTKTFLSAIQAENTPLLALQETMNSSIQHFSQAVADLETQQTMLAESLGMTKTFLEHADSRLNVMNDIGEDFHRNWTSDRQVFEDIAQTIRTERELLSQTTQHVETFLTSTQSGMTTHLQGVQDEIRSLTREQAGIAHQLLESHSLLTGLLHDMKNFLLDEQNGLKLLTTGLDGTFGEARQQYQHLSEYMEDLYRRIHESQEQLAYVQETTSVIHQFLQNRRGV